MAEESQKRRMKMFNPIHLPRDIEIDILARLPVKSLMRFRSVCKDWCNLLLDQDFIDTHHRFQIANSNDTIIVKHGFGGDTIFSILSSSSSSSSSSSMSIVERISVSSINGFRKPPVILGPVKGLLCLCEGGGGRMTALWNPATREFKTLPFSPIKKCPYVDHEQSFYNIGFGFDAQTNDYKILRFDSCTCIAQNQVELYSLQNDSWRQLSPPYPDVDRDREAPCYETYNNAAYFWAPPYNKADVFAPSLLLFDFGNEVFTTLQLPSAKRLIDFYSWPDDDDGWEYFFEPMVFNGRLARIVCEHDRKNRSTSIDIWLMTEDGDEDKKDPWNLHERLDTLEGILEPLRFWKNRLFMSKRIENWQGELVLYDLGTKQLESLQLGGDFHLLFSQVSFYVESLVRLNNNRGGRVEHDEPFVRRTIQN